MIVEYDGKKITVKEVSNVLKLLETLDINKETCLVIVNNKLVTEDYRLKEHDEIRLIKVVSGG